MYSPRTALSGAIALACLSAGLVWFTRRTPAPLPASAPPTAFSADRAMTHVRAIAQRPHPSGTADHARVREYVVATLKTPGLEPEVQETTGVGTHNTVAAHVLNVLARLSGRSAGGPAVLLVAHYDSVPAAPAAGDDGAAVGALLETVRALRAGPALAHDVIVLFTDGEESGLTGAAAFVREHRWAKDVAVALNFEGRGTDGPSTMFETGAGNLDSVRALRQVRGAVGTSFAASLYRLLPNDTDVSELVLLGQPVLNFAFSGGVERYHTPSDDVTHLDVGSVQHHGELALALARAFADEPLPRPRTGDAVFFNLPVIGLAVYPVGVAMPVTIAALVVAIGAVTRLRRDTRRVRDIARGIAGTLASAAIAAVSAAGVGRLFDRWIGGPASGAAASRGTYATAIALLATAIAAGCWTLVRRHASAEGARAGAVLVWALFALGTVWALPGASYLFAWPALAVAAASLVSRTAIGSAVVWTATIVVLAVVVPAGYGVAVVTLGMSETGAIVMSVFVAMTCWLLARHMETMIIDRRVPLMLAGAAVTLLLAAAAIARPSATYPEPSMLAYAYDGDSSRAWLLTPAIARPGSWAIQALGALSPPGAPVPRSARVVAPPDWRTRAIAGEMPTLAADATPVAVGVPDLAVVADASNGPERRLEFRVRPAAGTYSIRLRAIGARVVASEVDGRAVDMTRYRSSSPEWTLGYVAPQPDGFTLTLTVPKGAPLELDVIARSLGLPPAAALAIPPRPDGVLPIHSGDQTVVHRRIRL